MRFNYTDAEVNLIMDALAEFEDGLRERVIDLQERGHDVTHRRLAAVQSKLDRTRRLTAKLGNDASGYTVEESEASLKNL